MDAGRRYQSAEEGIDYLTRLLRNNRNPQFAQMVADGAAVQGQYGRVFSPENLHRLGAEEFKEFLLYEHNRHWWGIHRHQAKLVSDMDRLRRVLGTLLDATLPIATRLDWIEPAYGPKPQPGLGKAVFTPILHVVHPDQYGVWNSVAESAMARLRLWPGFPWGATFGTKYVLVNQTLLRVSERVGTDLWTLDSLWWLTETEHEPTKHQFSGGTSGGSGGQGVRAVRALSTFLCARCFLSKPVALESTIPSVCLDCNPER